jgi:predicted ATPase
VILTPDQRLRVFVSSTLGELAEERQAVRRAIESLQLAPVMFEQGARPHPPRSLYRAYLEQSHVFVAIYWERYGWIAPDMEISGLEDELILSDGMPTLMYVKRPAPNREEGLEKMLDRVRGEGRISYRPFETLEELEKIVAQDLLTLLTERFGEQKKERRRETRLRGPVPAPPSALVGRDEEVAALLELLMERQHRLITLTGPGGVGKTRLAIETASSATQSFPGGVFFVPLHSVEDAARVPATIVRFLGLSRGGAASPDSDVDPANVVRDYLRDRRALLILDNFEQLRGAEPVVADLLATCAGLTIAITSRAPLRLQAEREFPVEPLSLPHDGIYTGVSQYDAVRLFIDRAKAVRPNFKIDEHNAPAVAEICHRLDGLPLAIELAAARVKLMQPEDLLRRLDDPLELAGSGRPDLPERQQTMRNTILWSYGLLDDAEKDLFARLGVFVGGFTLEAVEAVCAPEPGGDLVDPLSSLIDKSLVHSDPGGAVPGFGMLRMIRSFAVEQLEASGLADGVRSRHAEYFVERALAAHDGLRGPEEPTWQEELLANSDNLHAAYACWLENRDPDTLADVGWALWMFWWLSGAYHREGRELMTKVLERNEELSPRAGARARAARGSIAFWQADYRAAMPDLSAGLERFERLDDQQGSGFVLTALALIELLSTGAHSAEMRLRAARESLLASGDRWAAVLAMNGLLWGLQTTGQLPDSPEEYHEALAEAEAIASPHEIGMAQANLGRYYLYRGDAAPAMEPLQDWLESVVRLRHKGTLASVLEAIGEASILMGDPRRAVRLMAAASAQRGEIGAAQRQTAKERTARSLSRLQAELGNADFQAAWADGERLSFDEAVEAARVPMTELPAVGRQGA